MRRNLPAALCALAVVTLAFLASPARGQSVIRIPGATDSAETLRRGQQLETQRRWGDALTHYEDALRQFPGDAGLKQRFDFSRLHYEFGRRYHDRSYLGLVNRLSLAEALNLYHEVLLKVQTHYVDQPRWRGLVEAGARGFDVALSEPTFLSTHAPALAGYSLEAFREELRQTLAALPAQDRLQAREAVGRAALLAQQRLGLPPAATVLEFLCGAASSLDPYSTYLTPDQLGEVYSQIEGNFVGLGVELKAQDGALLILRVIGNSPAKKAGLVEGDRIVSVDGQSTAQFSTDRAANLLQGPPGSDVQLAVLAADGQARQLVARRERIEVPSVDDAKILPGSAGAAYLKITCFQKTTYRDLDAALWNLHRAGMRTLVVDLRGNPGGLLVSAVEAADLFLERGVIVSTHGRSAQEDFTYSAREPGTWRVPLAVLVDQDSASAAEIFAGAIRDHRRGTIVGKRSYGKGSVQGIFPLTTGNAGLRLTTAKFYSPLGHPYSGVGVEPHLTVHQTARPVDGAVASAAWQHDPFVAAALQTFTQPVAQR